MCGGGDCVSEQIVNALIAAASGIVVALIGFAGNQLRNKDKLPKINLYQRQISELYEPLIALLEFNTETGVFTKREEIKDLLSDKHSLATPLLIQNFTEVYQNKGCLKADLWFLECAAKGDYNWLRKQVGLPYREDCANCSRAYYNQVQEHKWIFRSVVIAFGILVGVIIYLILSTR